MKYLGEWLTLAQAMSALGVDLEQLRALSRDGDVEVSQIRPGVWRVQNESVQTLLASPEWRKRKAQQ